MRAFEGLRVLKRHRRTIVLLCASAVLVTTGATYLVTEKYEAKALVLVRPAENVRLTRGPEDKELVGFPVGGGLGKTEVPSNTYIQIIKSRAITEKVVRMLHLDAQVSRPATSVWRRVMDSVRSHAREWGDAVTQFVQYGRVLGLPSPFEQAVERVQKNITLTIIRDALQFEIKFEAPSPQEAADVANAAADLFREHMAEMNTAEMKSTLDFLAGRLRTAESELASTRQTLRQYKQDNLTIAFKEETAERIKVMGTLQSDLDKINVKLAGLLMELTPQNPKVVTVQAEKDRLEAALKQRQVRTNQLAEEERQLATLNLGVQMADEVYQLIRKEYEEARIRQAKNVSEIRVVSRAVPPFYPTKPIKYKYAGSALAIALLAGLGLALLLEYLDTAVQSVDQVEHGLGLRVLATIPHVDLTPLSTVKGSGRTR